MSPYCRWESRAYGILSNLPEMRQLVRRINQIWIYLSPNPVLPVFISVLLVFILHAPSWEGHIRGDHEISPHDSWSQALIPGNLTLVWRGKGDRNIDFNNKEFFKNNTHTQKMGKKIINKFCFIFHPVRKICP